MRKLAVLGIGLLGLTSLVGCGGEATKPAPDRSSMIATAPAPAAAPPGLREQAPPKRDDNSGGQTVSARKEVVTGSVEITADAPIEAAGKIADQVRAAGGRIDSRTEQPGTDTKRVPGSGSGPSATLTVRVPADRAEAFIDGLGSVGRITRVSTTRDDVTMQWEDLDARMKALQVSVDRLRALIAGATNTADLLNAEQALSSRQGQLDSLTAQKRHLDDQIALSTLTIEVTADERHSGGGAHSFWDGMVSGWNSLVSWLQDAVVFAGKAIPWLGFVAVIAAVVWAIARPISRRKKAGPGPVQSAPAPAPEAEPSTGVPGGAETSAGETGADSSKRDDHTEQP
ncbi:DUF4349 domain-containing protein [Nocardia sp. NPDC049190]|uniref:DUF4349 domain-containing protein n=1 Tax=Nocardia sp. NPDC049190 TaxID=3155650 RepID=UPI0033D338B7